MSEALLSCEKIKAGYNGAPVLHGISLKLHAGQVLGVIGANGSGKSTLLQVLAGLLPPTGGVVNSGAQKPARHIAYLEQAAACHWPITVREAVTLGRLPHLGFMQSPTAADAEIVSQAMRDADVVHLQNRKATGLSGGEQARVALARALAVQPKALLADEPVAGLDPAHQLGVMELLRNKSRSGMAVAAALHDLSLAARFCDRLLLLHEGRMMACGAPKDVLTAEHVRTALAVEVMQGEHEGEPFVLPWAVVKRPE